MRTTTTFILGLVLSLALAWDAWADTNPQHIQVLEGSMGSTNAYLKEQALQSTEQRELSSAQVRFQEKFEQLQDGLDPVASPAVPAKSKKSAKHHSNALSPQLGESPAR